MSETLPEVMTIQETADFLRIPLSSLYKLAREGKIPCTKIGRHWRFHRPTISRWMVSQQYALYSGNTNQREMDL